MHCDIHSDSPLTIQCQPIDTPQTVDRIDSQCGNPADTVFRAPDQAGPTRETAAEPSWNLPPAGRDQAGLDGVAQELVSTGPDLQQSPKPE